MLNIKRIFAVMMVVIMVFITGMGCGTKNDDQDVVNPPNVGGELGTEGLTDQGLDDPGITSGDAGQPTEEVLTRSGTYVGHIDGHSVEIKMEGLPSTASARAFQLSDELKNNWKSLDIQEGDKITVTFTSAEPPVLLKVSK